MRRTRTMRVVLPAFVLAAAAWLMPPPAPAQVPQRLTVGYDIYVGGFHALDLALDLALASERYEVSSRIKTRGVFGVLWSWENLSVSRGRLADLRPVPERYETRGAFRGQMRTAEVEFRDGRISRVHVEPPLIEDLDREEVPAALLAGARDPLSTILAAFATAGPSGNCDAKFAGFDGRRRFDLTTRDRGIEAVEAGRPVVFRGDARHCSFVYQVIAGVSRNVTWGEDRQKEPQTGRAWIARVSPDAPLTPVKLELDSTWGRTIVQLRETRNGAARN